MIVTISRQAGAGGEEIARVLAQGLGWRVLDNQTIEKLLEAKGLPLLDVAAFNERKPDLWHRLSAEKNRYLQMLKLVSYEFARRGPCVILGRGGQILFADVPAVVRVRVVAPLEQRIRSAAQAQGLDERRARQAIEASDAQREGFYRSLFHVDWDCPTLYDLVLNTRLLSATAAAELVMRLLTRSELSEQVAPAARCLESLYLTQQAVVSILFEQHLAIRDLRIVVDDGTVRVEGSAQDRPSLERARDVAAAVFTRKQVRNEIRLEPRFAEILSGVHAGGANGTTG